MRWSLVTQLRLGFVAALFLILVIFGVTWGITTDFKRSVKGEQRNVMVTFALYEAQSALWKLHDDIPQFMIGDAAARKRIFEEEPKLYAIIESNLGSYTRIVHAGTDREMLAELSAEYLRYKEARPKFFDLYGVGRIEEAIAWRTLTITPYEAAMAKAFARLINMENAEVARDAIQDTEEVEQARYRVLVLSGLLLLLLALGYWTALRALRPIRVLRTQAERVVREQLGETIDASASSNEVEALVESFQLMSDRLLARNKALLASEEQLAALNAGLEVKVASRTEDLAIALEAATESDRMKTEFMANVTHELRTPLNSVIGFAELLKDEVPGPLNAKQAAFAADILASGQRLLALVEGILEMSRLDTAGVEIEREPVEISAALEERLAAHRQAAKARGVTIALDVAPGVGSAELGWNALRRMLDALIDNAVKFNREGGTVTVSAQRAAGALEIAVADTGIGIAREDLPKLFKPLVQLDGGLARRHGGVGLGLALARRLAELHGGTLEVASEPGKGSTFTLRLPIQEQS